MVANTSRVFLVVHGFVQGVGYRAFVKEIAYKYNIKGFVRNSEDGSVEILAEGNDSDIKNFMNEINIIKRGAIEVTGVEVNLESLNEYK
ncbi:MAG: acylphosphatase, partial [Candidatus Micrarchaeia archaeon]